jgi:hypothetical protein
VQRPDLDKGSNQWRCIWRSHTQQRRTIRADGGAQGLWNVTIARFERSLEATLPELFDLLKPDQLSQVHQTMVRRWVNDLAHLTSWHINMIYQDLVADFSYGTFTDAKESDWQRIADWFQARLEGARRRR